MKLVYAEPGRIVVPRKLTRPVGPNGEDNSILQQAAALLLHDAADHFHPDYVTDAIDERVRAFPDAIALWQLASRADKVTVTDTVLLRLLDRFIYWERRMIVWRGESDLDARAVGKLLIRLGAVERYAGKLRDAVGERA